MSHFVYPSGTPLGTVPFGYVVPSPEWQLTIRQVFRAINGDEGGTWAPSSFIVVGGSGFSLTGTGHQIAAGGRLTVQSTGEIRVANGGLVRLDGAGGDILMKVAANVATIEVESGALVQIDAGGALDIYGSATFKTAGSATWQTGCSANFSSGSTLNLNSGATFNQNGQQKAYGQILVMSTGDITFTSGANLIGGAGSSMAWSGAMIVYGDMTLAGSTNWVNLSPDRTLSRVKFDLISLTGSEVTVVGGGTTLVPDLYWYEAVSTNAPAAQTSLATLNKNKKGIFRLLDLPVGAVLESVVITSQGYNETNGGLVLPTYRVVSWQDSSAAGLTNHSSTVTDTHTSGNFLTTALDTTITVSGGGITIEADTNYGIYCVFPYNPAGTLGTGLQVNQVFANLSADKITLQ